MNNNDIHAIADNYSDNSHCFGTSHQNAIADKANLKIFTQLKKDSENYKTASMLLSAYRIADDIEKAKLQENIIQALDRM